MFTFVGRIADHSRESLLISISSATVCDGASTMFILDVKIPDCRWPEKSPILKILTTNENQTLSPDQTRTQVIASFSQVSLRWLAMPPVKRRHLQVVASSELPPVDSIYSLLCRVRWLPLVPMLLRGGKTCIDLCFVFKRLASSRKLKKTCGEIWTSSN